MQGDKIGSGSRRPKEGGGQAAVGGGGRAEVEVMQLDLVGFQSVRKYTAELASKKTNHGTLFLITPASPSTPGTSQMMGKNR